MLKVLVHENVISPWQNLCKDGAVFSSKGMELQSWRATTEKALLLDATPFTSFTGAMVKRALQMVFR